MQNNKLNELNRMIWFGLVLFIAGTTALIVVTNFFTEPLLNSRNILFLLSFGLVLIFYIYSLIRFLGKRHKSMKTDGNEE